MDHFEFSSIGGGYTAFSSGLGLEFELILSLRSFVRESGRVLTFPSLPTRRIAFVGVMYSSGPSLGIRRGHHCRGQVLNLREPHQHIRIDQHRQGRRLRHLLPAAVPLPATSPTSLLNRGARIART